MRSLALRSTELRRPLLPAHEVQIAYLTQSARLEETMSPRLVRLTALLVSISILGFIGWASQTNINEIARSAGEVVPLGYEQSVQHLDGGTVKSITVSEGAVVEAGDILVTLEGVGTSEDLARAKRKQLNLKLREERLRAFLEGRQPDFRDLQEVAYREIAQQMNIFKAMMNARSEKTSVADEQLRQRGRNIEILEIRRRTLSTNLVSLLDLLESRQKLFKNGHLAKIQLLEVEQRVTSLEGEIKSVDEQLKQARDSVAEFTSRRASIGAGQQDDAYRELELVTNEAAQNQEVVKKLNRAEERLYVRSPVRGIVKGLSINTIGAVIQPGQRILDIVPLESELIVETRIAPQHIGHVHVGQAVEVKISAYDVSRYGAIPGKLSFISATTFAGEEGRRYYRGRVQLAQSHAGADPSRHQVLPGMTAMVEIITGEKTILEYLLKPVNVALNSAFSER